MAKISVLQEVEAATALQRKEGEADGKYLERLGKACARLHEDKWGALSKAAQDWSDAATQAINDKKDVPLPGGFKATKAAPAAKEAKPAKEPKAASTSKKEKKEGLGKLDRMNELVLRNPSMKSQEILAQLLREGFNTTLGSVQGVASTVRSVITTAKRINVDVRQL